MRHVKGSPVFRRTAALVIGVALLLSLAAPAVSGAATPPKSTIRINRRYWPKAKAFTVSGSLPKKYRGQKVYIEVRKPGRSFWTPLSTRTLSRLGKWSWKYTPKLAGRFYIRARFNGRLSRTITATIKRGPGTQSNVILYSTTSVRDAGIWEALKPAFLTRCPEYTMTGEQWLGTGQSLTNGAELGMADVILAHAPQDEQLRVSQGYAKNRHAVMYNYFAIVGPKTGGPTIAVTATPGEAHQAIADWNDAQAPASQIKYWSRNDNSGTNQQEKAYWASVGNPQLSGGSPKSWYNLTAAFGMGKILNSVNAAAAPGGYTLADTATWLFQSKTWSTGGVPVNLKIIATAKNASWFNEYSVLEVVNARNGEGAADFSAWIRSPEAQTIIQNYGKVAFPNDQLFYPNAGAY